MEQACKPNSVSACSGWQPFLWARRYRQSQATYPERLPACASVETGRFVRLPLFGLAPRGVYLAATVTGRAGELLPHRFTHCPNAFGEGAGLFSVALVVTRVTGARKLSGSLPFGVRTFLPRFRRRLPGLFHLKARSL